MYVPAGHGSHSLCEVAPAGPTKPKGQEVHIFSPLFLYVFAGQDVTHDVPSSEERGRDVGHSSQLNAP